MQHVKSRDLELWHEWNQTRTEANLKQVLDQLNPVIQNEVNRWAGTLARPVLEIEAKTLAREAIESFSPNAGAALATHVTNRLKKLSRLSYTHQNIARMPEYQSLKFTTVSNAKSALTEQHGREPTVDELADELNWSRPALEAFQKNVRKEYIETDAPPPIFDTTEPEAGGTVDFVYHDLAPKQKKLFEFTTGYRGTPVLNNAEIMKRLKMTQGQLSYQKRILVNKFNEHLGGGSDSEE
jgi:hypothetical protein